MQRKPRFLGGVHEVYPAIDFRKPVPGCLVASDTHGYRLRANGVRLLKTSRVSRGAKKSILGSLDTAELKVKKSQLAEGNI